MQIYKLQYTDKETAIADLLAKGVYKEVEFEEVKSLAFGDGIQAIVEVGKIVDVQGTFDEDFKELTPTTYFDGYHFDIMSEQEIIFENEIKVKNPKHTFAGYQE